MLQGFLQNLSVIQGKETLLLLLLSFILQNACSMTPIPGLQIHHTEKQQKKFPYSERIKFQVKIFSNKGQFTFVTIEGISKILLRFPYITFRVKVDFPFFRSIFKLKKGKYLLK